MMATLYLSDDEINDLLTAVDDELLPEPIKPTAYQKRLRKLHDKLIEKRGQRG